MKVSDLFKVAVPTPWRKQWRATFSETSLVGEGTNKDQAIADLIARIKRIDTNGNTRHYEVAVDGTVFALYWAYDGWCYDIIHAGNASLPSSCQLSTSSVTEALDRMRAHARQYDARS